MTKMDREILTTAQAAKLLGVSVRTAQLLIEGGSVPSWKTPGGHRRVYRADVETLVAGTGQDVAPSSAIVVAVAGRARLELYERMLAKVAECSMAGFDDTNEALLAIGSLLPHAVIVDLSDDADGGRAGLVESLAENPALCHTRIMVVDRADGQIVSSNRVISLNSADAAVASLRMSLADRGDAILLPDDPSFPVPLNERQRLAALERTGLVDTAPEECFDRLTWLAARTLDAPVALLTLLTPSRQWFKSRVGLDLSETPRSWGFCNYTVMQKGVFSVEDLTTDSRFAANPSVTGELAFRFYAGAPVFDPDGFAVGSLCVIDDKARALGAEQAKALRALAGIASDEIRLRVTDRRLREALRRAEPRPPRAGSSAAG